LGEKRAAQQAREPVKKKKLAPFTHPRFLKKEKKGFHTLSQEKRRGRGEGSPGGKKKEKRG